MFLIASVCAAQTTAAPAPNPAKQIADTVTVAQGTSIPLTLVNPVKSKSTKPGDAIRALVAFPITVGSRQAIPAGTYVEGTVASVTARAPHTHQPEMQIHFTRLVFANGYAAPLDGVNTAANLIPVETASPANQLADANLGAPYLGERFAFAAQTTTPTLPTLPSNGPSPALGIGISAGAAVGILAIALISIHHGGHADYILFDNGYQFQMTLQAPLTLDSARVAAASK
jgi:hypothetical protein